MHTTLNTTLFTKIQDSRLKSRKDNKVKYDILTLLLGEVETLSKRPNFKEEKLQETIISTIKKLIKSNQETLKLLNDEQGDNKGRIQFLQNIILEELLPEEYSESQIRGILYDSGFTNIGQMMKFMEVKHAGKYDRTLCSEVAREILKN